MYAQIDSASVYGISAFIVNIEVHLDNAIPAFIIVGLPDAAVRESKERVQAAIKNSDLVFPSKKITVNLAPGDLRKEGSGFDLPIAIALLATLNIVDKDKLSDLIAIGELSLDGMLRPVHGVLSIALEAKRNGKNRIILPAENADEAALIEGLEVIPCTFLKNVIAYLNDEEKIESRKVDIKAIFEKEDNRNLFDIVDVKGQENVKRALEVAAAGGHNLLMIGPPGSGKTMLAKRLPGILPPLSIEEALETTKIHSISGILPSNQPLITQRPFRSPHHTISDAALVGGGMNKIKPGEISLSNHGVLFLDELPEFHRNVLEVLRQPLEDKRITISRTRLTLEYPANFMLICSMNPCPCGNYGNPLKECTCNTSQIQKYLARISGPLLDRIDIHVEVPVVKYQELSNERKGESSEKIKERVVNARMIQAERFQNRKNIFKNADMHPKDIREYCKLKEDSKEILKMAMTKLGLSARAYDRILKVSRTIADISGAESIKPEHISEAIQYRSLDRQYWK